MNLGKIEKVDIREIWKNETQDFTKWLSQDENLKLLGEEIGVEIKLIKTEANVGSFSADILAEEVNTGRKIIIENQLEITDHEHLGKLITYASGFDADILIWIFKDIRDEHRQAIDWLNDRADTSLYIFAIKMELWKIGDSLPAPKFQIICSPNNWAKMVKQSSEEDLSETKLLQLNFWNEFSNYLSQNSKKLKPRKARPQHWYDISIGSSQLYISCIISIQSNFLRCAIYIPNNKELFRKLFNNKEKFEKELGFNLIWEELPDAKASRIKIEKHGVNLEDRDKFEEHFKWFKDHSEKIYDVIPKYL